MCQHFAPGGSVFITCCGWHTQPVGCNTFPIIKCTETILLHTYKIPAQILSIKLTLASCKPCHIDKSGNLFSKNSFVFKTFMAYKMSCPYADYMYFDVVVDPISWRFLWRKVCIIPHWLWTVACYRNCMSLWRSTALVSPWTGYLELYTSHQ